MGKNVFISVYRRIFYIGICIKCSLTTLRARKVQFGKRNLTLSLYVYTVRLRTVCTTIRDTDYREIRREEHISPRVATWSDSVHLLRPVLYALQEYIPINVELAPTFIPRSARHTILLWLAVRTILLYGETRGCAWYPAMPCRTCPPTALLCPSFVDQHFTPSLVGFNYKPTAMASRLLRISSSAIVRYLFRSVFSLFFLFCDCLRASSILLALLFSLFKRTKRGGWTMNSSALHFLFPRYILSLLLAVFFPTFVMCARVLTRLYMCTAYFCG